jgi:rhomboid protease GluP
MTWCVSEQRAEVRSGILRRLFTGPPDLGAALATRILIHVNILVFIGEAAYVRSLGAVLGMPEETILAFGGNYVPFVFGEARVETLLASCFVHWSLLHVAFNLYALREIGPFVERSVGLVRVLPMYLASGIAGSIASASWGWLRHQERISAGASGAICGVFATAAVLGVRTQGWRGPIVRNMLFLLAITIALGFGIGADNAAHIGGAIVGALFAAAWRRGVVYTRARQRIVIIACALVALASGVAVAVRERIDPFAALDLDDRLAVGERFVRLGDCPAAIEATRRALKVDLWSSRARVLQAQVVSRCGR